jgi:glucose-1-phosphate thymidylyltransferase
VRTSAGGVADARDTGAVKGLVLAGGAGTRLRPITHTSAKQLVPIGNRPVLDFGLEAIAEAGITDVGIVVGDTHREVRAHVGDGSRYGLRTTFIRQWEPLGLAHAVLVASDFLGDDDFVVYLGDNLVTNGIVEFVEQFRTDRPAAQVMLAKVDDPEQFGVAVLDAEQRIVQLLEKPTDPPSDLALVGVYLCSSAVLDAARTIAPAPRGELEITDAIQALIDDGRRVGAHVVSTAWWKDTGRLEDLLDANRIVLDGLSPSNEGTLRGDSGVKGRVVIEPGAELVDSFVRGPAVIGGGARLVRTFIGPYTSIAGGCEIVDSTVEHSVILADSVIRGVERLEDSLIGKQARVTRGEQRPRATRLMLGDHSQADLP